MTDPATLALWFAAGAAVAWRFTALHYRDRLTAMETQRDLYRAWWERDSGKMIVAQAGLDLIREQRREAGRQSRKAERALIAETTEKLRRCVAARDNQPLDGAGRGVCPASSPAREGESPSAPLSPRRGSAARPPVDLPKQKGASYATR